MLLIFLFMRVRLVCCFVGSIYLLLIDNLANLAYVSFLLKDHEFGNKLLVISFLLPQVDNSLYNFGFENELFHLPSGNRLFSHTNTNKALLFCDVIVSPSHVATDSI